MHSRDDCVDAGTDSLGSKSNYEEFETTQEKEQDAAVEGFAAEDEEEGAEDDKGEDLDLSTQLESVVYCPLCFRLSSSLANIYSYK